VSGDHEVPVGGGIAVTATRRDRTGSEPEPAAAP